MSKYQQEAEELYPLHDVFSKDERDAHIKAREMSAKEIEELKREIERLKMDNMAHEYNQAEAQRFAPEYERQIREDEADKWREQVRKLREGVEENEQFKMWDEVEDIFDKHTMPTGGGYEADYTDRRSFFNELQSKFIIQKKQLLKETE